MAAELDADTTIQTTAFCSADLWLAELCPASAVFLGPKDKPTPGMWYGIFVHRFLEYCTTKGHDVALAYVREKCKNKYAVKCCESINPEEIPVGDVEVAFAHDPFSSTGRRLARNFRADPRSEMFGKADVLPRCEIPHVADYKCGPDPDSPEGKTQLLGLAASLVRELGWRGATRTSIVGVRSDGALLWRSCDVTAGQIDDFEGRCRKVTLRVLDDRVAAAVGERVPFIPGQHCGRCHYQRHCPAAR